MKKTLPAFATFFVATALLSGCQPNYCPIDDPYWTETYPSSSWETPIVDNTVYVDDSYVDTGYVDDNYVVDNGSYVIDDGYVDNSYIDDGYTVEDSTYSEPWIESYPSYSGRSIFSYRPLSSSYYYPSYSSNRTYYPSIYTQGYSSSVSYPSPSWQNQFLGQRPSSMYYYSPSSSWEPVYPSYRY